ncbi:MAG: translation initiation factor IF-2 [Planctomycetota bacterium]
MATTRVYILAKELGVKSGAIVEKCQAEGLDVKNHMATISAGLAATIREWFSEGEHTTTVETTGRVDLKKVRVKRKLRKVTPKKQAEAVEKIGVSAESAAVEEQETAASEILAVTAEMEKAVVQGEVGRGLKDKAEPKAEPEPIIPAGPMLETPRPAELSGPKVVRFEAPEPEKEKRPRGRARPRVERPDYNAPMVEPLMSEAPEGSVPAEKGPAEFERGKGRRRKTTAVEDEWDRKKQQTTVQSARRRQRDMEERRARLDATMGDRFRSKIHRKVETKRSREPIEHLRPEAISVSEPITVKDLSAALAIKVSDLIGRLLQQGVMATANQSIDRETAEMLALELGIELVVERQVSFEDQIIREFEEREKKHRERRCPVVAVLGHVDHGKTSLLDRIRSTDVAAGEAGGITQHIGAYQVSWGDKSVTFLDTPGHEAFTAMRARGANMTDIVVLVVAVDDGVMPQTIEAINHAKAAEVPILVALNKIDLPSYDINRIYGELAEHGLTVAEWGGQTEVVKTSAITGEGIENLLEHLDYISELQDLRGDNTIPATGWVVESEMTPQRGVMATLLVKEGMLRKGDVILAGQSYGRVRMLRNSRGKIIKEATSSMPVEVVGLDDVPQAGDRFFCLEDINKAKDAAEENKVHSREDMLARRSQVTLDNLFSQIEAGSIKELNIIIRADVQGSVDVLVKYLSDLSTEEVKVKILHSAVGGISEGDVVLAEASGAIIIGFNVVPEDRVRQLAESSGVDIRLYSVIYRITEDLKKAMSGLLEPEEQERRLGRVTVRETFKISGVGTVAGCYVTSGLISRNAKLRLIRDNNIVIRDNCTIESLRHFKDDVREVRSGMECGVKIAGFDDIKTGDVFDAYEIVEVARSL